MLFLGLLKAHCCQWRLVSEHSLLPQRRPNFALNSPQPIVRLATKAVVHHLIINANFVRIEDISPKVFTIYFLMNCSDHITEKSQ
jgi:hypothetical protein